MQVSGKQIIEDGMMSYSAYVLLQRAIPSLYDGLKISYRRVLYSMYKNKINNYTKSQNIVGEVAKIHPHGSIYPTMVGMAQTDRHIQPFIDGKGNFGEYTSSTSPAAAERYTNVRLNDYGKYMLKDIYKKQVDFSPSYDGTQELPDLLPVKFPIILAFAQSGMGVGFSSTTASFNIGEIADMVIKYVETGKYTNIVPDFATGGQLLLDDDIIKSINHTGKGTVKIRGKATIDKNTISITEIPYATTREAIIDKIVDLAKTDKLSEVTNIQDLTGFQTMEILVTARKGTDMPFLLEKLYQLTPLESSYSVNSTVLFNQRPHLLGVKDIVKHWIDWRINCINKELSYDISLLENTLSDSTALYKVSKDIDFVIKTIRSNNKTQSIKLIRDKFDLTFNQSEYIYSLQLRQLNKDYINKEIDKLNNIEQQIEELKSRDPKDIIIEDMKYYKKRFGTERKTAIIDAEKVQKKVKKVIREIKRDLIDDRDYWITITDNLYLYKTPNKLKSVKGDNIKHQWKLNNLEDEVFVYTHSRQGYKTQIRNIEPYSGNGLGEYIPKVLDIPNVDDIIDVGISSEYYPIIVQILSQGRIVKFDYTAYRPGVTVFKNTHTDKYSLHHVLFLEKESKLQFTDKLKVRDTIHTKDIRFTKNRFGSGQFINHRRNDIIQVKR